MTMEGFVRAVGAAMGAAQDLYGTAAPDEVAPAVNAPVASSRQGFGTGQAAEAADAESVRLNKHATALSDHNAVANRQLADTQASINAGRARVHGHIGEATADVARLAPASGTPHGQRALVTALTRHLQNTKQTLQDGDAASTTHAAGAHTTAQTYHSVLPSTGPTSASPAASGMPMGAAPLAGLTGLPGMMGSPLDGSSGGQSANQQRGANTPATDGSLINAVVQRALSQHGTPYVWGGGGPHGPTNGGYDCSSLMQYAFSGAGVDLPRTTYDQIGLGRSVSPGAIQAGDLIFSNFGEGGVAGPGHVQLAISPTHVVEAPHTGTTVRVSPIPAGHFVARRIL